MYSRQHAEQTYTFEPSGGLLHAALVMQDRETDSYWSIMTEQAIHGPAAGRQLELLPGAVKTTFADWRAQHPETLVLSVEGREHDEKAPYDRYFSSTEGFRGLTAADDRLPTKAEIFVFRYGGEHHAVAHDRFERGGVFVLGGRQLFLYREKKDSFYRSTVAWLAPVETRFEKKGRRWRLVTEGGHAHFDRDSRRFEGTVEPEHFEGFDTFWYIWSRTHPDGILLNN